MPRSKTKIKPQPQKRNKISKSDFYQLVKEAGYNQTTLIEALEKKEIFRDKMTIQRWCSGERACRDLHVIKALAKILKVEAETVADSFKSFENV